MNFKHALCVVFVGLSCAVFAGAATWYANAANYGKSGLDGTTLETAWGTLQDAHDHAAAGDTIKVLPGDYCAGTGCDISKDSYSHTNRLWVTKQLTFESTDGAAKTIIRGQHDTSASNNGGEGPNGIRCVGCKDTALGSVFRGFTFADGASGSGTSETLADYGGGFGVDNACSGSNSKGANVFKFYVVDSIFTNCVAKWGGAMRGGTAIRCQFIDNIGDSFGQTACAAALWNCRVERQRCLRTDRPLFGNCTFVVNCTVVDASSQYANHHVTCYNSVFVQGRSYITLYSNSAYITRADKCYTDESSAGDYVTATDPYLLLSPGTGDFRLRAGSPAVAGGSTAYVTNAIVLPSWVEMTDFAGHPIDLSGDTVDAGCYQGSATVPATGRVHLPGPVEIDGYLSRRDTFARSAEWPKQLKVVPKMTSGTFLRYRTISPYGNYMRYAQCDGSFYMVPPFDADVSYSHEVQTAQAILWCDPNADAAAADGTEAHPYRTLQAAMDAVSANPVNTIVYARPGVYAEGSKVDYGHNNRLVLPDAALLLKSTGGAAVTTIKGQADPEGPYPVEYPGCGTNAMRCMAVRCGKNQAVQGFTLADGHGCVTNMSYKTDVVSDRCGAVYGNPVGSGLLQLLDCVVTNCTAVRGGAFYWLTARRCVLDDCVSYGGVTRYCYMSSTVIKPSCSVGTDPGGASQNFVVGTDARLIGCTVPESSFAGSATTPLYNSLFGTQSAVGLLYGSVFAPKAYMAPSGVGAIKTEQYLADAENEDWRLLAFSPARTVGVLPEYGTSAWTDYEQKIVVYSDVGIDGAPLTVTNGKPMPGAYQKVVPGVLLAEGTTTAMSVTGASEGVNVLDPGESVTLSVKASAARPACGAVVNGTTNLLDDVGGSLALSAEMLATTGATVEPLFPTNWYVDVVHGDNANTGFSTASARRTLAAILPAAVAGDTVYAAPGVYDQDPMVRKGYDAGSVMYARADVPAGVTLVATGTQAETIIAGASSTAEDADAYGRGLGAVRCVFLGKGALVKGFTLSAGRTRGLKTFTDKYAALADWHGGAATAISDDHNDVLATRIENCLVTNCVALCGGAGYNVTFVNCRLLNCRAQRGSATERCGLYGTLCNEMDSEGGSGLCVNNCHALVNCTIGPNIRRDSTAGNTGSALFRQWSLDYGVTNTVVLGSVTSVTNAYRCAFYSGYVKAGCEECVSLANAVAAKLDAAGRPTLDSPLVDKGAPGAIALATDVYGGQRVYNGAVDIGAVEADWRTRYAADLGRGVTVATASPGVQETATNGVTVPAGELLSGTLATLKTGAGKYRVAFVLAADSTATVTVNGVSTPYSTPGTIEHCFTSAEALNEVSFACTSGTAELLKMGRLFGCSIILR